MTSPIEHFYRVRFSWIDGSNLSCLVPLDVFRVMMTLVTILLPDVKSSRYSVFNSVISPSQTYFVSFILRPIDLRKCSIKTSVFLTYEEKTSDATIGQKGTFGPSSWATAKAMAVFPVPGGPARSKARPAIFLDLIRSTVTPAAYLARIWPTIPWAISDAYPSYLRPSPLMWVCVDILWVLVVDLTYSILSWVAMLNCENGGFGYLNIFKTF